MGTLSAASKARRAVIRTRRAAVDEVLRRYRATNPRLFGSVARGDATESSDIDLLVDLERDAGNPLLRVAGISEELSTLLEVRVDVVAPEILRDAVSATALADAVAV